jgi:hypothetical protein
MASIVERAIPANKPPTIKPIEHVLHLVQHRRAIRRLKTKKDSIQKINSLNFNIFEIFREHTTLNNFMFFFEFVIKLN